MKEDIKLYVASPLGFSEVGREFMYNKIIPIIKEAGYIILDPWKLTSQDIINSILRLPYGQERQEAWKKANLIMGRNNKDAIKISNGLVAILDGADVDSGTASEIGFGAALGNKILGYRGDFRLSADNEGSMVNLQVEYFIRLNGGKIITEIKDLRSSLKELFGR